MTGDRTATAFAPWIKRFPGEPGGATVVFPHAGGAAAAYRPLATALSGRGVETYVVQYPQRAERLAHPAADTVAELARELFDAGPWDRVGPLRLFGHCLGALVAFEFARLAEADGLPVTRLWASASQAPSTIAGLPRVPTDDREMLADIVSLGGTDPRLLADPDFIDLLLPAVRADYRAFNRYACEAGVRIDAHIHAVGGTRDHRIAEDLLRRWADHTRGRYDLTLFDGGHFYVNDHTDAVVDLVSADGR